MGEAILIKQAPEVAITAVDAIASGEIRKMADGRAGVYQGLRAAEIGDRACFATEGQYEVTCASALTCDAGAPIYWDLSANTAILSTTEGYSSGDDFYLGRALEAKTSGQLVVKVQLNLAISLT